MTMVLGDEVHMVSDLLPQQRMLAEPLLKYRFNGYYKMMDYALVYLRNSLIKVALVLLGVNAVVGGYLAFRRRRRF